MTMQKLNLSDDYSSENSQFPDHLTKSPQNGIDENQYLGQNHGSTHQQHNPFSDDHQSRLSDNVRQDKNMKKKSQQALIGISILAIFLGTMTGLGAYRLNAKSGPTSSNSGQKIQQVAGDSVKVGDVFGVQDQTTFKDSAQGYLEEGGVNGEGSHKLLRAGGDSQTVVLTSSVTDLSRFEGMEVKIWGETFKAQKAGWLMDVGRVEVVDTAGSAPTEN